MYGSSWCLGRVSKGGINLRPKLLVSQAGGFAVVCIKNDLWMESLETRRSTHDKWATVGESPPPCLLGMIGREPSCLFGGWDGPATSAH